MSNAKIQPLSDLERFDLLQAMFPGELSDDNDGWDAMEDLVYDKFNIDAEDFDLLVGHLVMCAPVMGSPLTGTQHHVLGSISFSNGQQHVMAAVKREAAIQEEDKPTEECDHDWEDMGDGTMACTYPECNATRPKRPEDSEEA
ncbi:MAG: hypothetical protein ABGX76_04250 [Cobetia sp.]|jgi:hypothetical protein|uniref:hypothetical protein n=1 Tax=Cobetia sp. TaxID=1873876 RepID=UPI00324210FA